MPAWHFLKRSGGIFFPPVELGMVGGHRTPLKCRKLCALNPLLLWDTRMGRSGRRAGTWPFLWAAPPLGKALASPRGELVCGLAWAAGIEPFHMVTGFSLLLRSDVFFLPLGYRQNCSLVSLACMGRVPVLTPIPYPVSSWLKPLLPALGLPLPVPNPCSWCRVK